MTWSYVWYPLCLLLNIYCSTLVKLHHNICIKKKKGDSAIYFTKGTSAGLRYIHPSVQPQSFCVPSTFRWLHLSVPSFLMCLDWPQTSEYMLYEWRCTWTPGLIYSALFWFLSITLSFQEMLFKKCCWFYPKKMYLFSLIIKYLFNEVTWV